MKKSATEERQIRAARLDEVCDRIAALLDIDPERVCHNGTDVCLSPSVAEALLVRAEAQGG